MEGLSMKHILTALFCSACISVQASIVYDDFSSTTPNIPTGWHRFSGASGDSYDNSSSTTLSMTGGRSMLLSNVIFNPDQGLKSEAVIQSLIGTYMYFQLGITRPEFLPDSTYFNVRLYRDGILEMHTCITNGQDKATTLKPVNYSGGNITLIMTATAAGFRIETSSGYDSNLISWENAFGSKNGFTFSKLGSCAEIWFQTDSGTGVVDSIKVDAIPEPATTTLLGIGSLIIFCFRKLPGFIFTKG